MTIDEKDKLSLIKYRIERAYKSLNDAEYLILRDKLNTSVNRIYYSIFYILSALALKHSFITSKHQQLIGWFNRNLIKTNIYYRSKI